MPASISIDYATFNGECEAMIDMTLNDM